LVLTEATILSIQVGTPRRMGTPGAADELDREWESSIFKQPVSGPVRLGLRNLEGDGQADLVAHGTPDQAVLLYAAAHYLEWRATLGKPEMVHGAFGENFTVAGLSEATACVGDTYAVGEALIQVSQPRGPCWKLARRNRVADLHLQVQRNGRGGWYARVLREGIVEAGLPLILSERPYPEWTVARVNDVIYRREPDPAVRAQLAACPLLSATWQRVFSKAPTAGV
jgi:MOSC domain-containing protein YiiM